MSLEEETGWVEMPLRHAEIKTKIQIVFDSPLLQERAACNFDVFIINVAEGSCEPINVLKGWKPSLEHYDELPASTRFFWKAGILKIH